MIERTINRKTMIIPAPLKESTKDLIPVDEIPNLENKNSRIV